MAIKKMKPTSPGVRTMTYLVNETLTEKKPYKRLLVARKEFAGRNCHGRITVRHHGGGVKHKYRIIDFNGCEKMGIEGTVESIAYDPNRSANIALISYVDGDRRYILAPQKLEVSHKVIVNDRAPIMPGNRMFVKNIPPGVAIFNIEINKGKGGQICRSAGNSCVVVSHDGIYTQIRMPSGGVRYVNKECMVSVGVLSNEDWNLLNFGKAGRKRRMGWRPTVRGSAMNPCDHRHGGGNGKCPIGLPGPVTPWGKKAYGVKTRKHKYSDKWLVKE